jgi:BirA family biotin operon repressor/biotin-[acetyl-CoA-carboxylase] ligase
MNILHFDELDSTNSHLQSLLLQSRLPDETIVLADLQTAGRGQSGNSWIAPKALNLTFSLLTYHLPPLPAADHFLLSQAVSLALKETCDLYLPPPPVIPAEAGTPPGITQPPLNSTNINSTNIFSIKWPNDIFWNHHKLAGILIENDITATDLYHSIIGIGVNINQTDFPPDLPNATSLKLITGAEQDRFLFLQNFLQRFHLHRPALYSFDTRPLRSAYRHALYRKGLLAPYQDDRGIFDASIEDVAPDGRLLLKTDAGKTRIYAFKELQFLPQQP